jgi:CheY-like chemotaxis protein/anti-sigma regulatory factor (Ser/Thr protein kinase)
VPQILVVDDSAVDRKLVAGLLARQPDWSISSCANGREAIERLETPPLPDVVVSDLRMPEMDGLELVETIKDEYPFIPVILLTAKGSEEIAADALRRGAASYVPKRRLADDLVDTIRRILNSLDADRNHLRLLHYLSMSDQTFLLRNDFEQITQLAGHVQQLLRCLPLGDETERLRVSLAFEEAVMNACLHGNLEIESPAPGADRDELSRLIRQRSSQEPYSRRRIEVSVRINRDVAELIIRDQGPGFDHATLLAEAVLNDQTDASTRGLALMRTIFDEVTYNEPGNCVTLTKRARTMDELLDDEDETRPAPAS